MASSFSFDCNVRSEIPHAVGARGILVPIAKDRGGPNSKADAVCRDFRELRTILQKLES